MQGDIFIQDMTEDDRKSINDYRLKHPDFEGKWMQYRYAEKIPLNDINSIMESTPIIRGMIAFANAHIGEEDSIQKSLEDGSSANYFITPQNRQYRCSFVYTKNQDKNLRISLNKKQNKLKC
ncbi:MAG: hypothetical protein K5766_01175 [Alphaproteobacteria bacterium]|nr:hypothetical protein [Alphaproteobacteria bacterium]